MSLLQARTCASPASVRTRIFLTAIVIFAAGLLTACSVDRDVKILKLAHNLDTTTSVHKAMVHLAERLHELSDGSMRVDIYPSGQLGQEREYIELLQIGSLAMTKVSASPMEGFVPEMRIFSIPYVFRSEER